MASTTSIQSATKLMIYKFARLLRETIAKRDIVQLRDRVPLLGTRPVFRGGYIPTSPMVQKSPIGR
jgi:hypothetical protein